MVYTELKNGLEQLLKEDLNNRSSLQEMRRNVFLNSESVTKREKELEQKENLIAELSSKIEKKSTTLQTKDERINELEQLVSVLQKQNTDLQTKIDADSGLWDEVNKLTVENNHFATKIRDLIFHIDSLNEKEEKLNKELTQKNSQLKAIHSEKEKVQQEFEKLSQQKLFSGEEQDKLGEENSLLKQKNEVLDSQLTDAKFLLNSQNLRSTNTEASFEKLKNEFNEAIENLSAEKALIVNDNANLVADHDLLAYDNEHLKEDIELLRASFEEFSVNKHQLIEGLETEKIQLNSEIEALKVEIANLNSTIITNAQLTDGTRYTYGTSEQENEEFIDKLFKQIDLLNDEKLQLNNQKQEIESELEIVQQKFADLSEVIENQSSEIKNLEDKNKHGKLAQALVVSSKDKTATKLKINELVREIDKCIALLSV